MLLDRFHLPGLNNMLVQLVDGSDLFLQCLFYTLPFGDVSNVSHVRTGAAKRDFSGKGLDPFEASIFASCSEFVWWIVRGRLSSFTESLHYALFVIRVHELPDAFAEHFLRRVAEHSGKSFIDKGEAPILVDVYPGQRAIRKQPIPSFTFFELLFRSLHLVDLSFQLFVEDKEFRCTLFHFDFELFLSPP